MIVLQASIMAEIIFSTQKVHGSGWSESTTVRITRDHLESPLSGYSENFLSDI